MPGGAGMPGAMVNPSGRGIPGGIVGGSAEQLWTAGALVGASAAGAAPAGASAAGAAGASPPPEAMIMMSYNNLYHNARLWLEC
jgi:hypothetical protein